MTRLGKVASRMGCLVAVLGPLIGVLLYPRATWLFAFVLVGIAVFVINYLVARDPTPLEVADRAERLLEGWHTAGWDVDDYEHLNPHEPRLRELWSRTMYIGGMPEDWLRLDEPQKCELRNIISQIRALADSPP
jgi:hypothetical protein